APIGELGSPNAHEYRRLVLSTGPWSEPLAWNETGTPQSAVLSGPAPTVGLTLATGTEKSIVFDRPVGSVIVTCPERAAPPRRLSGKGWLIVFPNALPPSSNAQTMSRLPSPHGLRLPPGPVPLTASVIGLPSWPSPGIVSIAAVGAMLFGSKFPRSTF